MIKIRYAFLAVLIEHQTIHLEGVMIGRIFCLQVDGCITVGTYKQWLRGFPFFSLTVTGRDGGPVFHPQGSIKSVH